MRKVSATVIYKDNTLYNLTVNHKGVLIPLVVYDEISVKHPYEKRTFQTMYKSVLNILKNNNFYCGYYEQFGDRKSTRLNSSHTDSSRMPSSA